MDNKREDKWEKLAKKEEDKEIFRIDMLCLKGKFVHIKGHNLFRGEVI